MDDIGDRYQQETKYVRDKMTGGELDWENKPATFKKIEKPELVIKLPQPELGPDKGLFEVLSTRRSRRDFTREPIDIQTLSLLLWAAQGPTAQAQHLVLRTAPSAGGLYPIETYLLVNRVQGVEPGVYHFFLPGWELHAVRLGDQGENAAGAALQQEIVKDCAATFIFSAMVERSKWKYKQRAYRYVYLDAGHIGQNLHLAAESLELGCCMVGAFFDDELNALLGADGIEETALYLGCVGPVG